MAIADMFRLLSPLSVEREINGELVTFYTCSIRTCARLSTMLSELAGHMATLMGGDASRDQGTTTEDYQNAEGDIVQKTITEPINPSLAKIRADQKQRSLQGAVDSLMSDKNRSAIGALMMDSMKDKFPRGKQVPSDQALDFVDGMDVATFIEVVKGVASANAKVFGDLGKGLGQAVQDQAEKLLGKENVAASLEAQKTDG